jgi:hypothetical protein
MSQHWMVDILADLRQFAQKHSMNELAEQLDDTIIVATRETSVASSVAHRVMSGHDIAVGNSTRQAGDRDFT